MGLVTDIKWRCPGCDSLQVAQVYGEWNDPIEFPVNSVPGDRSLKWNPPCAKCGKYQLKEPSTVTYAPALVKQAEDEDE